MVYVVGFSAHRDDHAAIDLACKLARSDADQVRAVTVVPSGWPTAVAGHTDREFEQWAAEEGDACAVEAQTLLTAHPDVPSEAVWLPGRSVPATLLEEAQRVGARLIVVGSGDEARLGGVTMTSKTSRLLHSSPVAVAIAPRGYQAGPQSVVRRVSLAFRGDDQNWEMLEQAAEICSRIGASIRVITFAVRKRTMYPPTISGAEDMVHQQWRAQAEAQQAKAIGALVDGGFPPDRLTSIVAVGRSWDRTLNSVDWGDDEVLVVGSSSTHRLAAVFLGSSAAKIVRHSPVPVIVVP